MNIRVKFKIAKLILIIFLRYYYGTALMYYAMVYVVHMHNFCFQILDKR